MFCLTSASKILNTFFEQANGSRLLEEVGRPVGVLITTRDVASITKATSPPVPAFQSPFLGASVDEIRQFARDHLGGGRISDANIVLLDQKTVEDSSTCLLITSKDWPQVPGDFRTVRSDFASSLATLNNIEFGCAGEEYLDDSMAQDGVVRLTDS